MVDSLHLCLLESQVHSSKASSVTDMSEGVVGRGQCNFSAIIKEIP